MKTKTVHIQKRHKIQIGDPGSISILLVGCGGTGSFTALNLARMAATNQDLRINLVFIDPDHVEEKNIGRQYFCPADIGHPKATVLAQRLGLAFGLEITPLVQPFHKDMIDAFQPDYSRRGMLMLIIGCVDTPEARQSIAGAMDFRIRKRANANWDIWWLDGGNDKTTGQILLGNVLAKRPLLTEFGECVGLPLPSIQEPAIVQSEEQAEPEPTAPAGEAPSDEASADDLSCADLVALNVQARTINYMIAAWLDVYTERLLITHDLDLMATTLNQQTGQAQSEPIAEGEIVKTSVAPGTMHPDGYPGHEDEAEGEEDDNEWAPCPVCDDGEMLQGEDVIDGEIVEIIFCEQCDWRIPLADYEAMTPEEFRQAVLAQVTEAA